MADEKELLLLKPNRLDQAAMYCGGAGRPFRLKPVAVKGAFELRPSHAGSYGGAPEARVKYQSNAEWLARASNAVVLLKNPEEFITDAIDIITGVATPEQHARMALQICRDCRSPISERDQSSMGAVPGQCFTCTFWNEKLTGRSAKTVIVDGRHYSIGSPQFKEPPPPSPYGGYGFGGARWEILFNDGRREVTHNLWSQGEIPERYRALPEWQDNAVFVPTKLDHFKAEVAGLAGIELNPAPGTCAHGEKCHGDRTATVFTDEASATEYRITGLCQRCQDVVFAEPSAEPQGDTIVF